MKLHDCDLTKSLSKQEYRVRRKAYQHRLLELRAELIKARLPVLVVFEGWDAAGKGGTIRRLVEPLDPRSYAVHAISKPTQEELDHHYLWRFWTKLPRRGEIAVFDRSWYGRVLVERIEGFASRPAWKRAYREINEFERQLVDDGHVIVKLFLHISKEEQRRRFAARSANPLKAWKLNAEDYRNRKRWDEYEEAIDDMISQTHAPHAPWHVIPAEDKRFARVAVQDAVVKAIARGLARNGSSD